MPDASSRYRWLASAALILAGFLTPALLLEMGIRAGLFPTLESTRAPIEIQLPDDRLGFRPNPQYPSHDQNGWRNFKVLEKAEFVALGDSQTYGLGASVEESWPAVVGSTRGFTVYQMAFGGFGPAHYVALVNDVLRLKPKTVVASLYFGNDVLDTYWMVYRPVTMPVYLRRQLEHPVLDQWVDSDPALQARIQRVESIDPHHVRNRYLDCQTFRDIPHPSLQTVSGILELAYSLGPLEHPTGFFATQLDRLGRRSELIRLGRIGFQRFSDHINRKRIYSEPLCLEYKWNNQRVVFSPAYRLLALDESDPRVAEGARLALKSLAYLADRFRQENIRFQVLFIPTKELVFKDAVRDRIRQEPHLAKLWSREEAYRNEAFVFFKQRKIPVIDSLPNLKAALAEGKIPYPHSTGLSHKDADGHPNAIGYSRIADAVNEALGERKN